MFIYPSKHSVEYLRGLSNGAEFSKLLLKNVYFSEDIVSDIHASLLDTIDSAIENKSTKDRSLKKSTREVEEEIKRIKKTLILKIVKNRISETFGYKEFEKLNNKYKGHCYISGMEAILQFDQWCDDFRNINNNSTKRPYNNNSRVKNNNDNQTEIKKYTCVKSEKLIGANYADLINQTDIDKITPAKTKPVKFKKPKKSKKYDFLKY
jgi:hypothetical protein